MAQDFAHADGLAEYLKTLCPEYGQYAQQLWDRGVRCCTHLGNADKKDLVDVGVLPFHASDIKAKAAGGAAPTTPTVLEEQISQDLCVGLIGKPLDDLPTENELATFLSTIGDDKIPVTDAALTLGLRGVVPASSYSFIPAMFTTILQKPYRFDDSEEQVGQAVCDMTTYVWDQLAAYTSDVPELLFSFNWHRNRKVSNTTTNPTANARPDLTLESLYLLLFAGEEKIARERLIGAIRDLVTKFQGGLHAAHYGHLPYILGYVASGDQLQFCSINRAGQVRTISPVMSMARPKGRLQVLLCSIRVYRLLLGMSKHLPNAGPRFALFTKTQRPHNVTIEMRPTHVLKTIQKFSETKFDILILKELYTAASTCEYLVHALQPPTINSKTDRYSVQLTPIGYSQEPDSEQLLQKLAKAACHALCALHGAGLVHRDIRFPNFVRTVAGHYVLVDLEHGRRANEVAEARLAEWDEHSLTDGRYDRASDMYQLGKLLLSSSHLSEAGAEFANQLCAKDLSAIAAVQHVWLS